MGLQRKAKRHEAGVDSAVYADFAVGDRVMVVEGFLGTVTAVEDGPYPGTEQYQVTLDGGMGGGEYASQELTKAAPTTAASTGAREPIQIGEYVVPMPVEGAAEAGLHVASEDYPELSEILVSRPPLAHSEPLRMGASKTAAGFDQDFEALLKSSWDTKTLMDWALTWRDKETGLEPLWKQISGDQRDAYAYYDNLYAVSPDEARTEACEVLASGGWGLQAANMRMSSKTAAEVYRMVIPVDAEGNHLYAAQDQDNPYPTDLSVEQALETATGTKAYRYDEDTDSFAEAPVANWMLYGKGAPEKISPEKAARALGKEAAATDWAALHAVYFCPDCGFRGETSPVADPATGALMDVCPSCGKQEPYEAIGPDGFGVAASRQRPANLVSVNDNTEERAAAHVAQVTAGFFFDKVLMPLLDKGTKHLQEQNIQSGRAGPDGRGSWSYDWCRFRKNRRCFYPQHLNAEATEQQGYAIWIPIDRGICPRDKWDQQRNCEVSEPGPNSGERGAMTDATVAWEDGGQREGRPSGKIIRPQGSFEFTASWSDVRAKARRIREDGGIRILVLPEGDSLSTVAEVKGDNDVYETTLIREPGRKNVASWSCGCAWAAYSWGRSGRWKKYEGRMCAHALALAYETQKANVTVQPSTPPWRTKDPTVPGQYDRNPLGLAASLRPLSVDPDLGPAPAVMMAQAMLAEGTPAHSVMAAFGGNDKIVAQALSMRFRDLWAQVRGRVVKVLEVFSDDHAALVEGGQEVSVSDLVYPTYHPTKGLRLDPREATLEKDNDPEDDPTDPEGPIGPRQPDGSAYPYDRAWADPSRWGRDHFAIFGDDLLVFEPNFSVEMEQGDPAGAASWAPVTATTRIDIGEGRDVPWGHLSDGMNADADWMQDAGFLTPNPPGFTDPLAEPGERFAEASLTKQAYFDVPDDATVDEAADFLMRAAEERANYVTNLLTGLAKEHGGRMDNLDFRLKKRPRLKTKIEDSIRKKHIRPDQAAEEFQDALRFTMLVPPQDYTEAIEDVLSDLGSRGIRPLAPNLVKNYWLRNDEYDGVNTVLRTADGFPFELQFHTDESLRIKLDNHGLYDEFRGDKGPVSPQRRRELWDRMSAPFHAVERPPGAYPGLGGGPGFPAQHTFAALQPVEVYYAFADTRAPGTYTGVFRRVEFPDDVRFERWSNSQRGWVIDNALAGHVIKGDPSVDQVSEAEAAVIIAITRDLEGQALLNRLQPRAASEAHSEALVVDALIDPDTAPEMAEAIGESLASSPPAPGDPRLAWLMSDQSAGAPSGGAGGGSPATASDGDIAAQAKAFLAKQALKEFSPAEQQEIINEGLDVQAANLADLDIAGTHYMALEETLAAHENDEDWLL